MFLNIIISILSSLLVCMLFYALLSVINSKKQGLHVGKSLPIPKQSFFFRVFIQLPFQLVDDMFHREDYAFYDTGFHLVVGEQGSGKTITTIFLLQNLKKQYPNLKIRSNFNISFQDGRIKSWRDLIFHNNGIYGEIDVIDEVQNWFNSLESKDFPIEMMQEITQQRKQRKMILGTSQVWNRVAKPIREQVTLLYKPITLFGCLTIVTKYKPVVNDEGQADRLLYRGRFFFIQTKEIREAYDTYQKIQVQSLKGYKPTPDHIHSDSTLTILGDDCCAKRTISNKLHTR